MLDVDEAAQQQDPPVLRNGVSQSAGHSRFSIESIPVQM